MRIIFCYISLILIWATTPLAIKLSSDGAGFLFSVTARIFIALICIAIVLLLTRQKLVWHKKAVQNYLAIAIQIYGTLILAYWASQFIPSGWMALIGGLPPLFTAPLAAIYLKERSLTIGKTIGYVLGVAGLIVLFGSALQLGYDVFLGVGSMLLAVFAQSSAAIWVKRIDAKLPALVQVAGGLLVATLLYSITWFVVAVPIPQTLSLVTLGSILYLGIIASIVGFSFYYFLLSKLSATRVALVSLIAPPIALLLGHIINKEMLTMNVLIGSCLIMSALILHEFFDKFLSVIGNKIRYYRHH